MSTGKGPSRVTDGPYANWGVDDEQCQMVLASGSTVKIGQPVALDATQLGPDNNVPNNAAALPLCERVVAMTSANAGPAFGVVTVVNIGGIPPTKMPLSYVNGVPTYTNNTGSTATVFLTVCQLGFAYVWTGASSVTANTAVTIGAKLISSSSFNFAIAGSAAIGTTIGYAINTAINTTEQALTVPNVNSTGVLGIAGAPQGPGVVSIVPGSMVGVTPNTIVLIDTLGSGVQEAVSVGSISYPTFAVALANAHGGGFRITGPATNPAFGGVLISVPANALQYSSLVAAYVNVGA